MAPAIGDGERRTIVAVLAHPDDESFGVGGTLAQLAASGAHVALVCATRGEVGEIADPALATPETLGAVREQELRCAATTLGVADLRFLGYRDSGMAGAAANDDPRAFIQVPADQVVAQLVGIIRELRPTVVITSDPHGGYGHPDHIAVHRHTESAFQAAGDPTRYPERGPVWRPDRLFYAVMTRSSFEALRDDLAANGLDTSEMARFAERVVFWPEDQMHVDVDVADHAATKLAALECHRTQFGAKHPMRQLPADALTRALSHEQFALARPALDPGQRLAGLFAPLPGVTKP